MSHLIICFIIPEKPHKRRGQSKHFFLLYYYHFCIDDFVSVFYIYSGHTQEKSNRTICFSVIFPFLPPTFHPWEKELYICVHHRRCSICIMKLFLDSFMFCQREIRIGNSPEFQRSVIWLSSLQDFINQLKVSELFLIKFKPNFI